MRNRRVYLPRGLTAVTQQARGGGDPSESGLLRQYFGVPPAPHSFPSHSAPAWPSRRGRSRGRALPRDGLAGDVELMAAAAAAWSMAGCCCAGAGRSLRDACRSTRRRYAGERSARSSGRCLERYRRASAPCAALGRPAALQSPIDRKYRRLLQQGALAWRMVERRSGARP